MIPITKMRQKTSARLSCDAIFPAFSREFDRGFAALAHPKGILGRDREGLHRAAVSKNKENPKRPQPGDVFFDPEAV
jgi:hypothetical protein